MVDAINACKQAVKSEAVSGLGLTEQMCTDKAADVTKFATEKCKVTMEDIQSTDADAAGCYTKATNKDAFVAMLRAGGTPPPPAPAPAPVTSGLKDKITAAQKAEGAAKQVIAFRSILKDQGIPPEKQGDLVDKFLALTGGTGSADDLVKMIEAASQSGTEGAHMELEAWVGDTYYSGPDVNRIGGYFKGKLTHRHPLSRDKDVVGTASVSAAYRYGSVTDVATGPTLYTPAQAQVFSQGLRLLPSYIVEWGKAGESFFYTKAEAGLVTFLDTTLVDTPLDKYSFWGIDPIGDPYAPGIKVWSSMNPKGFGGYFNGNLRLLKTSLKVDDKWMKGVHGGGAGAQFGISYSGPMSASLGLLTQGSFGTDASRVAELDAGGDVRSGVVWQATLGGKVGAFELSTEWYFQPVDWGDNLNGDDMGRRGALFLTKYYFKDNQGVTLALHMRSQETAKVIPGASEGGLEGGSSEPATTSLGLHATHLEVAADIVRVGGFSLLAAGGLVWSESENGSSVSFFAPFGGDVGANIYAKAAYKF